MKDKISDLLKLTMSFSNRKKLLIICTLLALTAAVSIFAHSLNGPAQSTTYDGQNHSAETATTSMAAEISMQPQAENQNPSSGQKNQSDAQQNDSTQTNICFTPQATPFNCPAMAAEKAQSNQPAQAPVQTPPPDQQGFELEINIADIHSDGTGYYFPFRVVRKGGFTGKINPSIVTISPNGEWPNIIMVRSYFMLTEDTGAFILVPSMHHPQDVTITFTALGGYPYQASKSISYHFPSEYY